MSDKKVIIVDGNVSKDVLDIIRARLSKDYVVYTLAEVHQLDLSLNMIEDQWKQEVRDVVNEGIKKPWVEANTQAYILRLARSLAPCEDLHQNMRKQHLEEIHPKHKHKYRPPKKLTKCKNGWR